MTPNRPLKIAALVLAAPLAVPLLLVLLTGWGIVVWFRVMRAIIWPEPVEDREPISPPSR